MAKIDLYNARGLAKQSVGTPGVDKSGAYIEGAGGDILQATSTYIKAENAKREIADNLLAETERIKWENELYNGFEAAKQEQANLDNPYGLADSVFDKAQASAQSYAKNISNPRAREKFLEKSVSTVRQAQTSMRNWASGQTVTNAFINVKEGIDAITVQASKMNDPAGFNGVMSQAEALIANATPVIGTENAYRLRDGMRKDIANSFIYSKIDASPTVVKSYIDSGMFDGILSEHEQHSLRQTADSIGKRISNQQQAAFSYGSAINYQDMLGRAYEGKLTLPEVNQAITRLSTNGVRKDSKQMKNMYRLRDYVINNGGYKYATSDKLEALDAIDAVFGLISKEKVNGKTEYIMKNATLNQLQEAQDILDENSIFLTRETLKNKYDVLNQAWENHVENNPYASKKERKNFFISKTVPADEYNSGLLDGYRYIDKWYTGEDRGKAKRIFSQTFNKYYDYERKLPGFTFSKFMEKQKNYVDSQMGRK